MGAFMKCATRGESKRKAHSTSARAKSQKKGAAKPTTAAPMKVSTKGA